MTSKVCFFTVCGDGEERDFLLGSIEHHAKIGNHVVLDVSKDQTLIDFGKLPSSVKWIYGGGSSWGSGDWKTFKLASALEHARTLAVSLFPGTLFLVHLDCDEYYDVDQLRPLLTRYEVPSIETPRVFVFDTIHWRGGKALKFGPSERHLRAWDVRAGVRVVRNLAWKAHPKFNGNDEHHPVLTAPFGAVVDVVQTVRPVHYHLHYNLGEKQHRTETAETTIDGWPNGTPVDNPCPWPEPIRRWAETGELPSSRFSA